MTQPSSVALAFPFADVSPSPTPAMAVVAAVELGKSYWIVNEMGGVVSLEATELSEGEEQLAVVVSSQLTA
ncbi:hypothetical protein GYMLUDRAFT_250629 [Collybiopsis luxurians FD-317 M1]|uniref:Uncharacterized protein n=1 Tax=Collybiopsis luxurians FD-317 M1 TaxID=944289 RepID=A0A0D0CE05_9AGAR|nr:hypothetical protein GYMLUDRAFT_250629 [Collybiopsis luxurians FD-317 M1]